MLTRRSRAREVALQLLFQRDLNRYVIRETIEEFVRGRLRDETLVPFTLSLYDGVDKNAADLDTRLAAAAENWRVSRMAIVDRNVLRLGAFELLHTPETPPQVVLDEAIELARRFGAADSPAFVNGVLDRLRKNALPPT
jgi:N utilization substance protein B